MQPYRPFWLMIGWEAHPSTATVCPHWTVNQPSPRSRVATMSPNDGRRHQSKSRFSLWEDSYGFFLSLFVRLLFFSFKHVAAVAFFSCTSIVFSFPLIYDQTSETSNFLLGVYKLMTTSHWLSHLCFNKLYLLSCIRNPIKCCRHNVNSCQRIFETTNKKNTK